MLRSTAVSSDEFVEIMKKKEWEKIIKRIWNSKGNKNMLEKEKKKM